MKRSFFRTLVAALALFGATGVALPNLVAAEEIVVAQAGGTEPGELQGRYKPAPVEEKSSYNSSLIFGMTRGVAETTIHPAGKAPLYVLTIPLDIALLPFTLIGGFFG